MHVTNDQFLEKFNNGFFCILRQYFNFVGARKSQVKMEQNRRFIAIFRILRL